MFNNRKYVVSVKHHVHKEQGVSHEISVSVNQLIRFVSKSLPKRVDKVNQYTY
jgi:hypothetical protein